MITNPQAKRILCFGDSNTWGQQPDAKTRYLVNERWTGRLQNILGDQYEIIEEGLSSRTTNLEFSRKPGRKGDDYFRPCLESHSPLDLIIIMLGTNDAKLEFGPRTAAAMSDAIQNDYINVVGQVAKKQASTPKIAVLSPIAINPQAPHFAANYTGIYDERSAAAVHDLPLALQSLAQANGSFFADMSALAQPGQDGIHMSANGHQAVAKFLAQKIHAEWLA